MPADWGMTMQTKEMFSWLKLFIVSFVFIAAVWAGIEQYAKYSTGFSLGLPLERIILYAFLLAVVIATAQWVLRPKPKTAEDLMHEHMAEMGQAAPASEQEQASEGYFEPAPLGPATPRRAKRSASKKKAAPKKKAAKKKGRR